jgi:hypothetical protein
MPPFPIRTAIVAAALLSAGALSAQTQGARSVYTELIGGRCRFVSIDAETKEDQVKRCPGHGGAQAFTLSSHTTVSLGLTWSKRQTAKDVVAGWSLGDKIEWRGLTTNKGFEPYAAIVRVIVKDPDTLRSGGAVLAVLRIDSREATACAMGYVDVKANKNANALARDSADRLAPTFLCESDAPTVVGRPTRWTDALIKGE